MQRNCTQIKKWEIAEFIFIAIVGTLLHFVYDWSGQNPAVGIIAPVSESTWEHLKLLFMPALLFTLIQEAVIGKDYPCLLTQKAKAVLAGMAWIVVGFYTYTGVWGKDVAWIDILLFYTAVALYTQYRKREKILQCRSGNGSLCADIYPVFGVHGTTAKDRTVSGPADGKCERK